MFLCCLNQDSGLPSSLVPLKAQQDEGEGEGPTQPDPPPPREGDSPQGVGEDWPPPPVVEGHEEEVGSSSYISEALNNHFYYSNGILRPKPHSNAILLHPRGQII